LSNHEHLSIIQRAVLGHVRSLGLASGARILDAPCGGGGLAAALRADGYTMSGADIDPAAGAVLGDTFRVADLSAPLPWPDGAFDAVLTVEGIEHLDGRHAFLRELHRVLTPGGTLVLTTPNTVSLRSRVRFFGSGFFHQDPRPLREAAPHPLHHIGLMTFAELRYALRTAGFDPIVVGHTHIKTVSYLYAPFAAWMWLYTAIAFRKEREPLQRAANRLIRGSLFSRSLLFGENVMLTARRSAR
jgi:SAM-dependent methyltransferase